MKSLGKNALKACGLSVVLATTALTAAQPALAHHAMGGKLPGNFMDGFLSGIAHPVIGFDHLAFVIAAGIASAFLASRFLMPAFFIAGTIAGCMLLSVGGVGLPFTEFAIAGSVVMLGFLVMSGRELSPTLCAALFAAAGLFHGSAYAGEIVGVEATPLTAYLIGFSFVQYAIAASVILVTREIWKASSALAVQPRLAGALVAGVGLTFLLENVETMIFPGL